MAALDDLVSNLKNGVTNLGQLVQIIKSVFPQMTGLSSTATAGTATLPATPAGFIIVTLPNGSTVKVAYYDQ